VVVAETIAQAQAAVRGADKVRALGSRHSFNAVADTAGTHLALHPGGKFRNRFVERYVFGRG